MEWASAFGDRRAVFLTLALNRSLGEAVARDLLRHPVISGISGRQAQTWWRSLPRPNYLPPRAVALALADIVRKPGSSASLVNLMTALRSELAVESAEAVAVDGGDLIPARTLVHGADGSHVGRLQTVDVSSGQLCSPYC